VEKCSSGTPILLLLQSLLLSRPAVRGLLGFAYPTDTTGSTPLAGIAVSVVLIHVPVAFVAVPLFPWIVRPAIEAIIRPWVEGGSSDNIS
jgi:hypothetical protein